MKIISISGLDGSGKSTQVQFLKNYLESQKKRVFYFHAIQFGIANKFSKIFKNPFDTIVRSDDSVKDKNTEKSVVKANFFQIWLRKIFLKIDIVRFKKLVNKLKKEGYDYILTDRYFYDSVINIAYLSNSNSTPGVESNKIIKPHVAIYLQTDPEIIMQRERKPDQGIEYLNAKKELFENKIKEWDLKVINGNRTKEEVFEEIKKESPEK